MKSLDKNKSKEIKKEVGINIFERFLIQFWLWLGIKLGFKWIYVKRLKRKNMVEAITFSMTERYINLISEHD